MPDTFTDIFTDIFMPDTFTALALILWISTVLKRPWSLRWMGMCMGLGIIAMVGVGLALPRKGAASSAPTLGDAVRAFKSIYPKQFTVEEAYYASGVELIKVILIGLPLFLVMGAGFYLLRYFKKDAESQDH